MNVSRKIIAFLLLIATNKTIFSSYEFDFPNFLDQAIVIKINQRRVDNKDYYQIVNSFETVKQVFNNAYCLEKLAWAPYDATKPLSGGMDLVDPASGRIPEENQRKFGDVVAPRYAFSPIKIVMLPNEVYEKTVEAATALVGGLDTMACQLLNEAKSFAGIKAAENIGNIGSTETTPTDTTMMMSSGVSVSNLERAPLKDPNDCRFGLGQIANAAGSLAGTSLCRSLVLSITYELNNKNKPIKDWRFGGRPSVIALTAIGG